MSQHQLLGAAGEVAEDQQLGAADRRYYTDMCNQLFQRFNSIKARSTEGKKIQVC